MKYFIAGLFLLLSFQLCLGQSDKEVYQAWLDSMENEQYIGFVQQLDEVIISDASDHAHLKDPMMQKNMRCTDELLHCLPGVNMIRRGNFANEPMLRGLTSERYVLSIDGMRIYGACTDKMDPASAYIEPINLQSLDVSFGSQSNMMGCGTGGSVNFGLKKPIFAVNNPLRASIQSSFSSVSRSFEQGMDINYTKKRWAMRISGVHRKAQNYFDGRSKEVKYSQFEKINYAASLNYRLGSNSLIAFDFVGDDARDVGYPALPMDVSFARAKMFGLSYITDKLWVLKSPELKVYHNYINHEMDDTRRDSVAMHMDMPGNTHTTGGFLKGYLRQTTNSTIEVKADYHRTFWHAEMTMYPNDEGQIPMFMLTWPDVHRSIAGLELAYLLKIHPKHMFITSGRMELVNAHISSDFGERQLSVFNKSGEEHKNQILINVSSQYVWNLSNHMDVNFSLAYGERVPTVSEQFGFYLFNRQDGYDYLGDPDLMKERNIHLEVGQKIRKDGLQIESSLFTYFFKNYIMGIYAPSLSNMTIGALGVKWYRNTPNTKMWGGELSMMTDITSGLSNKLDIKYVYGEDFEGEALPQMPPLKISYSLNQKIKKWNIQPECIWSAQQNRISNKFNERTTSAFLLTNLGVSQDINLKSGALRMGLSVNNIFDVAYREHFDIGNILRPGRSFDLFISWRII